jgi:hypothetical protein
MYGVDSTGDEKKFSRCVILYLSGYSDNVYLRCAIELRAMQYVINRLTAASWSFRLRKPLSLQRSCQKNNRFMKADALS